MEKEKHIYKIKSLIIKKLKGDLGDEEEEKLSNWRNSCKENEKLFQQIYQLLSEQEEKHELFVQGNEVQTYLLKAEYQRYRMATECEDWEQIKYRIQVRQRQRILRHWLYYAATIVLFLGVCGIVWLYSQQQPLSIVEPNFIVHNTDHAILELSEGKKIVLSVPKKADTVLMEQYGISHQDTMLSYEKAVMVEEWHILEVPRGGEYILTLADGSRIWLNADSRLKFPACFAGDERKVYLERGEAYFQVVAQAERPFYVEVENMQIKVVGTEFNVMAYPEKPVITATLVEGDVQVVTPQTTLSLLPNEQSIFVRESGQISKKQVDVNYHISWRNGIFEFKGMPLDEVAEVLSRWYDVDFVFENTELKKEYFTGSIQRSKSLEFILDVIQETQIVKYEIIDKTIIFTNK